ncbi:hypothetical protein BO71DRAFT_414701, partial [Aspergillus ellipticus CBS 707.79]
SVVKGGSTGGILGLAAGAAGVLLASKRYPTIRNLTLPMKSFLVTSSGTFVGIIAADHSSRDFEAQRNAERQWYENRENRLRQEELSTLSTLDRAAMWARREKYKIVGVTWVASMVGSFALVGRNPYLSGSQKIVQARVYAQGLTLAVLIASAAFEIQDRRRGRGILDGKKKINGEGGEGVKKDVKVVEEASAGGESGDLWRDMVAAEEERLRKKKMSLSESDYQSNHAHIVEEVKKVERKRAEEEEEQEEEEEEEEKKE